MEPLQQKFTKSWGWQLAKSCLIVLGLYTAFSFMKLAFHEWYGVQPSVREASLLAQRTDWSPAALCASKSKVLNHGCKETDPHDPRTMATGIPSISPTGKLSTDF
jgi:hypothetical protein